MRVGIIGCGNISDNYVRHAAQFEDIDIVACADIDPDRARKLAEESDILEAKPTVDDLLEDDSIEIVINLTIPAVHAAVSLSALEHGKHVWTEKPLAANREDARQVLDAARAKGLRVGGAPDTFLGAGLQTARKAIDDGRIGKPLAATGFMLCPGHADWHQDPEFFYLPGGGPMLDMGPYYVTALLNLIPKRTIGTRKPDGSPYPRTGETFDVTTPDHVVGQMEFENGAVATIATSFSTWYPTYDGSHPITVFGEEGTMQVPDPNGFDGSVLLRRVNDDDWTELPFEHTADYGRAAGTADMAKAIATGRPHRGSAEQIYTCLDVMLGFLDAAEADRSYVVDTPYERPAPLPTGLPLGVLD
jgi:predicted dehydrogenase